MSTSGPGVTTLITTPGRPKPGLTAAKATLWSAQIYQSAVLSTRASLADSPMDIVFRLPRKVVVHNERDRHFAHRPAQRITYDQNFLDAGGFGSKLVNDGIARRLSHILMLRCQTSERLRGMAGSRLAH